MSKPRKRMSREDRKQDIIKAAITVFARKGYRPTSIDDLVEAAGISKGLFYNYFDSKKRIFIQVVESYFVGFAEVLERNHRYLEKAFEEDPSTPNVVEAWRENILRILKYHVENPDLTSIVYLEAQGSDDDFSGRVTELLEHANRIFSEEFRMMADVSAIRPVDIEFVTAVIMGATVYVIIRFVVSGKVTDIHELADKLLDFNAWALAPSETGIGGVLKDLKIDAASKKAGTRKR